MTSCINLTSKTYTNGNKVSSDDYRPIGDGWIGRARLPCLICKDCVNKVIIVLGQLRNICSAFCIAWSPWEQWAALDKKSQGVLKTTESVWCSIPVKHPGSGPRLQGLSTVSTQTTVLWHWSLQNSYPTAWPRRAGLAQEFWFAETLE